MSFWRTLFVIALAVGLGAYIYLVERPRMLAESDPDRLLDFDMARVEALELAYPGQPPIELERREQDWWMTAPIDADADDTAIDRLLTQIANAEVKRRIPTGEAEGLATYGLEGTGTQARISITLDDGSELPGLVVGDSTAVDYQAFVRVEGTEEIIVVPLILHSGVKKSVFDLREKKLFAGFDPQHAVTLELVADESEIRLEREGDQWRITVPIEDNADANEVRTILAALRSLSALAYFDDAEPGAAAFGLDEPTLVLRVRLGDDRTIGFRLASETGDTPPGFYVQRLGDGRIAKVAVGTPRSFAKEVNALRDKHLFSCKEDEIARITFRRSQDDEFALVRGEDGNWQLEPAAENGVRQPVARRIVSGLATLAGETIVREAPTAEALADYGLAPPAVRVSLERADASSCGSAVAGAVNADTEAAAYYVQRDGGAVMSVPAFLFSRMNMLAKDFTEQ